VSSFCSNSSYLPSAYLRYGHDFLGWRVNGAGNILPVGTQVSVLTDTIFVAAWGTNQFALTFRSHGSTLDISRIVEYGYSFNLPSLENTIRYSFGGWRLVILVAKVAKIDMQASPNLSTKR